MQLFDKTIMPKLEYCYRGICTKIFAYVHYTALLD